MTRSPAYALVAVLIGAAAVAAQDDPLTRAAATITQDDFAWRVGVIAHDSMQGRDTPSPGLEKTARWIASEFRSLGFRGGAEDGSFIQRYPLEQVALDVEASGITGAGVRLRFGEDLAPLFGSPSEVDVTGGVVLISGSTDSRAALVPGAVEGRHALLVLSTDATGVTRDLFRLLGAIREAGAASVMVVNPTGDEAWAARAARVAEASVRLPSEDGGARRSRSGAPYLQIRANAVERILAGTGVELPVLQARADGAVRVDAIGGLELTLSQEVAVRETSAPNVVGILDGSDPELKDEYVVLSGHMDHVGMGSPDENGDSIYNGADDDASGTVAVMEVAEALAALPTPPRRSMIFLLVSGEEKGLWGSAHYADNPSVPVERMVANLNADMVGRNWTDTIVAIGKEHSDLGETLNEVNRRHPELRMTAIDDLWPEERFYFRSDHYNFARKGVPILFFFNGTHEDYHGRDDEPERIRAEKAARIAKLLFYLGVEVGNADERPQWDPESYRQIVSDGV